MNSNQHSLTEYEKDVLKNMQLNSSHQVSISIRQLHQETNYSVMQLKGICGSLIKKGYIELHPEISKSEPMFLTEEGKLVNV